MDHDPLDARFEFAQGLIREAGALALDYARDLGALAIHSKGDNDPTTDADLETERLIRRKLAESWPDDVFVGEETGVTAPAPSQGAWVVDPIDGTACFLKGIPGWSISIAYYRDGEVELGLVFDPLHDELFAARRGHSVTLNGDAIRCGDDSDFTVNLTGVGASHRVPPDTLTTFLGRLLGAGGMFMRGGSCALAMAYVACGRLNGYYEAHINSWDAFAGYLLVREAGGWSNAFMTETTLIDGNEIAVSAPGIGAQMQALISGA